MTGNLLLSLAAGTLALTVLAAAPPATRAQGANAPAAAENGQPPMQGRGQVGPAAKQPGTLPKRDGVRGDGEEASGPQQGCPDQGRKLELIV
jgi:hypothetical protein